MTRSFGADLVERAFGEHRAFVQHRDLHAELAHEGHVVLDDDDRAVSAMSREQLGGLGRLGVGHAGDRLVDQQQLRVLRQQHADLEPLLLAVRQVGGERLRAVREPDRCRGSRRCASRLGAGVPRRTACRRRRAVAVEREQQVVRDGVALEHGRLLELAADAEVGDRRLVERGEVVRAAANSTSPSSGRVLPVMTSIMVVLPAPFGPMMARISPGSIDERKIVERPEAVEARP